MTESLNALTRILKGQTGTFVVTVDDDVSGIFEKKIPDKIYKGAFVKYVCGMFLRYNYTGNGYRYFYVPLGSHSERKPDGRNEVGRITVDDVRKSFRYRMPRGVGKTSVRVFREAFGLPVTKVTHACKHCGKDPFRL